MARDAGREHYAFLHMAGEEEELSFAFAKDVRNLGTDPASLLLLEILSHARSRRKESGEAYPLPFAPELLAHPRTHGFYLGDGRPTRAIKLGFEPAGVVFEVPDLFEIADESLPLPSMSDDGFIVSARFNQSGVLHRYVVFLPI